MSDDQDHPQEEAFDIEAMLDGVQDEDGYHPTSKTPSFFWNSTQVINDLKHVASFSLVGEPELDLRARWGLQMNLENHVRPFFSFNLGLHNIFFSEHEQQQHRQRLC
jgi:hypothetical protein